MIRTLIHISLISLVALTPVFADVPPLINYQGKISVGGVDFNGNGQFKFALVNGGVNLSQTATAAATVVNGFVIGATINSGGTGYSSAPTVTVSGAGTGAQLTATVSGGVVTGIQVVNSGSGYQAVSTTITVAPPAPNLAITTYWSNDGSSTGGSQPTQSISLPVASGGYSVLLGDAQIPNMLPIPIDAFKNDDVRLRVWFSDGTNGFQLMTPDQRISAVGYAMIAANVPDGAITNTQLANGAVTGSKIATGSVASNQLASGAVSADKLATGAVSADKIATGAVSSDQLATGAVSSEKLANGAVSSASARDGNVLLTAAKRTDLENQGFVLIGVLSNTTLRPISGEKNTTPPSPRDRPSVVWTGIEMIVCGGMDGATALNTGARFNPTTGAWTAMTDAPTARQGIGTSAVWTGNEMIVWGGVAANGITYLNTGSRYNPTTDTWTSTNTINAPVARQGHSAVWTGTEMIVWGGATSASSSWTFYNTGGHYNPATDTWTATNTTGAPVARAFPTAIWTGTEMIIWGGGNFSTSYNTGGRYNPTTNNWRSTNTSGAPDARSGYTNVWTGAEMIIWGGFNGSTIVNSGNRYNPITDSWTAISNSGAPPVSELNRAIWTGKEMIIWGGSFYDGSKTIYYNTGARYNPTTDAWTATNTTRAPTGRRSHTAVWTGTEMVVWGGVTSISGDNGVNDGGRYNPTTDSWSELSPTSNRAIWTGSEMIAWGGSEINGNISITGERYNPSTDTWTATSATGAPIARYGHTTVWTGTQMIVWGGSIAFNTYTGTGGRYNPATDTWTETSNNGAPLARLLHTAVWTGTEMIVWGGNNGSTNYNTGGRYNPTTDTWTATSTTGAPSPRLERHTAVWTGTQMIVWGGNSNTGGRYNPTTDTWTATSTTGAPTALSGHTAVWTGTEMIVWGGYNYSNGISYFSTGARYNPTTDTWTAASTTGAPTARSGHTAVWTGTEMIIWGGANDSNYYNTGARYNPTTNSWSGLSLAYLELREAMFVRQSYASEIWNVRERTSHSANWTGSSMLIYGGRNKTADWAGLEIITPGQSYLYSKP